MYLTLHDNNNDYLLYINSSLESQTLELCAHCVSGKLSAAILGKPSGENLAERMKMPNFYGWPNNVLVVPPPPGGEGGGFGYH